MDFVHYPSVPRFDVEKKKGGRKVVWLECSYCHKRIRQLPRYGYIRVDRGYYCDECDPGVEVPNPSAKVHTS